MDHEDILDVTPPAGIPGALFVAVAEVLAQHYKPGTTINTEAGAKTRAKNATVSVLEILVNFYEEAAEQEPPMSENEKLREALEKIARKTSITFGRGTMSGEEAAAIAREALSTPPSKADADDVERIKHMVDRFLMWRLPPDFAPDGGVIFSHTSGGRVNEPIGTNLLTAVQAEAMVRFMVEGLPAIQNRDAGLREALEKARDWLERENGPGVLIRQINAALSDGDDRE